MKNQGEKTVKTVAIEDLVTVVVSEFVKMNKARLQYKDVFAKNMMNDYAYLPYIKSNYMRRRRLSEKVIDRLEKEMKQINKENK